MATSKQGAHAKARTPARAPAAADLAICIANAGFTPSIRRLDELLDLFGGDETVAKNSERAVLRIEAQYAARVAKECVARARKAERPARGRLTNVVGRLAKQGDPEGVALGWLIEALGDPDPKTRRSAARALGNLERTEAIATALATAFDGAASDADRQAIAVALGKTGGEAARTRLVGREHGRAAIIAERELARETPEAIDPTRAHDRPLRLWFHTRSGLEDVLKEELGTSFGKPRFAAPGIVEAELAGPLSSALAIRTATHLGFPLEPIEKGDDLADDIVRGISSPAAAAIFRTFTSRPDGSSIRFRIELSRLGHQRSVMWRVAERIRRSAHELLNDPKASTWEVVVDHAGSVLRIELVPRGYDDDRFAYREHLVPASSHPAIAAALARVAPRRDDDVVWDPFVGAGAELVERARLGPYERLLGTDTDPSAVAAGRSNLERAGIANASIQQADACTHAPDGVTLILTNPPMGRRVHRGTHAEVLERFVAHAGRVLVPGGALVWLVPEPRRMSAYAAEAGLDKTRAFTVDMGGFSAELAVYVKRRDGLRDSKAKRHPTHGAQSKTVHETKRRIPNARRGR